MTNQSRTSPYGGSGVKRGDGLAFDRAASARTIDSFGRMLVESTAISKASINPYLGRELDGIPGAPSGLDLARIYQILRDPVELEKGAATFDGLPLLSDHPVMAGHSAANPLEDMVIGATGTDAKFISPYLMNSLVVWKDVAIQGIESDECRELSSSYRFKLDWTPGVYEGVPYDGRMTDIIGNHVALVPVGRAGRDVRVSDSNPKEILHMAASKALSHMAVLAKGALTVSLKPMLAKDATIDLNQVLAGIKKNNWTESNAKIVDAIKGKLAKDASPEDLQKVLDLIDTKDVPDDDVAEDDPLITTGAEGGMGGKVDDADGDGDVESCLKKVVEFISSLIRKPGAQDELPPKKDDEKLKDDQPVDKTAMDAAIATAVKSAEAKTMARLNRIADARAEVQPIVGNISLACDSAAAVYGAAARALGVDTMGVTDETALRALVIGVGSRKPASSTKMAMDASVSADFLKRFPGADRIVVL